MEHFPSFSVIVEWENVRFAGNARAVRTLRALISQIRELEGELDRRPELIILYEKGAATPDTIERALALASAANAPVDITLHATEGSNYYGQKNEGAEIASRDYLLFLDSDVVPEAGWLRELLGSVQVGVDVVAGSTYVEPTSFFGRAFGLFWFFPLRSPSLGLVETKFFYANNVIFKRKLFLAHKFPDLPLYRGHCGALGIALRSEGVRLYQQTNARVAHPPPYPSHFVHRALSEGYDATIREQLKGTQAELGIPELKRQLKGLRTRINQRIDGMEVGRSERTAAMMLGKAYYFLRFVGQLWAQRSPEQAQRMLGIRRFEALPSAQNQQLSPPPPQSRSRRSSNVPAEEERSLERS